MRKRSNTAGMPRESGKVEAGPSPLCKWTSKGKLNHANPVFSFCFLQKNRKHAVGAPGLSRYRRKNVTAFVERTYPNPFQMQRISLNFILKACLVHTIEAEQS